MKLLSYKVMSPSGTIIDKKHVIFNHQKSAAIHLEEDGDNASITLPPPVMPTGTQNSETTQEPSTEEINDPPIKEESDVESETPSSNTDAIIENNLRPNLRNRDTLLKSQRYGFVSETIPKTLEEALKIQE